MQHHVLPTLLSLTVARAAHEWSASDEALAVAEAAPLGLGGSSFTKSYSHHATALRAHLLDGYDKAVPPTSVREENYSKAGVDVALQLRFFKVASVDAGEGRMTLKVWMRTSWQDQRLAWNASEWGGVTQLQFLAGSLPHGAEVVEVWVPDLQPYNSFTGIHSTLDSALAMVSSDGSVFFSRPGMLDVMCKFSGLAAFPYDILKCGVEFGGWAMSGGYQGLTLLNGGYEFSTQESTAGSSYQEFTIHSITARLNNYVYACCANEPWPVITYDVFLSRSSFYYTSLVVIPGIMITIASFAVFFTEPEACDALAYGITVVLASEISKIVLVEVLPVCGETVWAELFAQVNTFFCLISLCESVMQTVVADTTTDTFFPPWLGALCLWVVRIIRERVFRRKPKLVAQGPMSEEERLRLNQGDNSISVAGLLIRKLNEGAGFDAHAVRHNKTRTLNGASQAETSQDSGAPPAASVRSDKNHGAKEERKRKTSYHAGDELSTEEMHKLVFFEHLFFDMDDNSDGIVKLELCAKRVAFLAMDHSVAECERLVKASDVNFDGVLTRLEFCELCVDLLIGYDLDLLKAANVNFIKAETANQRRVSAYWHEVSSRLDNIFGTLIPAAYVLTLTVLFSMTMTDEYSENPEALMFEGVGPFTFNGLFKYQVESSIAVMRMLIPVFIGIVIIVASITYGHMKKTKAKAKRAEEIARSRMKDAAHISVETMSATFDI